MNNTQEKFNINSFIKEADKYTGDFLEDVNLGDMLNQAIQGKVDNKTLYQKIFKMFGKEITDLVDGVTKINKLNFEVLENITGKYKVLEVINSGSCFELPKATLAKIKEIIKEKKIEKLFLESHWAYKNRIQEMQNLKLLRS